jgi:dihydrodipicolinate synthase/N-acetylneuraminate lyase
MVTPQPGVVVPMVTPFTPEGRVDAPAVGRLIDHLMGAGIADVLLLGTTGEAASLSAAERLGFLDVALKRLDGRARIFVGLANNSFAETVAAARSYSAMGVYGLVGHLPSYYPLSSSQMQGWFTRLADNVSRPLFLYNIPMTTRMSIPVETVMALADHPNIAGMKDSEYDVARMETLLGWRRGRKDFLYFVGPSVMALRGLELGADGFVPGVGNVVPDACRRLLQCARAGDWAGAAAAQADMKRVGDTYMPDRSVGDAIALLKATLHAMGLCGPTVLPPLTAPNDTERHTVAATLEAALGPARRAELLA